MKRSLETKKSDEFIIKKIILKDGMTIDTSKKTHLALIKDYRKGNEINYKISYQSEYDDELLSLSNECTMLAVTFKIMHKEGVSFEVACQRYDKYIDKARKEYYGNK